MTTCKNPVCKCEVVNYEGMEREYVDEYCCQNCRFQDDKGIRTACKCHHSSCIIPEEEKPQVVDCQSVEVLQKIQMPWNCIELAGWNVVGMNHYAGVDGMYLYVAMTNSVGSCITAEGNDEIKVFEDLKIKATDIERLDSSIKELIPKLEGRSCQSITHDQAIWEHFKALLEKRGILDNAEEP